MSDAVIAVLFCGMVYIVGLVAADTVGLVDALGAWWLALCLMWGMALGLCARWLVGR